MIEIPCIFNFFAEYPTESDLFESLEDGKVDKIWLFDCQKNRTERDFMIVKVFGVSPVIGAETKLARSKPKMEIMFDRCLKAWAENKKGDDDNKDKKPGDDKKDDFDDHDEEKKEDEEEEEALLEQVAYTISGEKGWENKNTEQVRQIFCTSNIHSLSPKYREILVTGRNYQSVLGGQVPFS